MTEGTKYYEDAAGALYGYPKDGSQDGVIPSGMTLLTDEEALSRLNPPEPPITAEALKAIVTAYRWEVETSGITLANGSKVATGLDDQSRITTVVANARLAGIETVKFKAPAGWVALNLAEVEGIAAAIALHVQGCFAAECAHHEAIDALVELHKKDPDGLQAALEGYDESAGWPGNDVSEEDTAGVAVA